MQPTRYTARLMPEPLDGTANSHDEGEVSMKIVVFGSTGGTGLELIKQAIKRGHDVTAFARDPSQIPISESTVRTVKGDVLDLKTVAAAVAGAQAAISALGVRLGQSPGTVRSEGTRNIVTALAAADVRRFVSVSTVGVGDRAMTPESWPPH